MYKVVIDAYGGDNAPREIVKGAIMALEMDENLKVCLVGLEEKINEILGEIKVDRSRVSIINAREIITNDESPTIAIKTKKDSSLVKAIDELRTNDDVIGLVGAGSTGAILTGAFLKLGRLSGVSRPALCPILPTIKGGIVSICDCGANVDCKPINLAHFALMGNAYLQKVMGIKKPRIALLNVGTEEHKGNELTHAVYPVLNDIKSINFVGNMEARDVLSGNYDLIVSDGFAGNILLKASEGAVINTVKMLKTSIKKKFVRKFGAVVFLSGTFKELKKTCDLNSYGGAVLLGCKKLVVKAHGSSSASSIATAILQVASMHKAKLIATISKEIEKNSELLEGKFES